MGQRWWRQATPVGEVIVVVDDGVVLRVQLPWNTTPPLDVRPGRDAAVARQFDEFFGGERQRFDLGVDLSQVSAPFYRAALTTLRDAVPWGETVTYGELAAMAGRPGAARAAGSAVAANPVPIVVPCHRVVAADGMGGYGGNAPSRLAVKAALLAREASA